MYTDLSLFIGGEWRKTSDTLPVINPANEDVIGQLPKASKADLDDALTAAVDGFEVWRNTSPRDRCNLIRRAATLMRERIEDIARDITLQALYKGTPPLDAYPAGDRGRIKEQQEQLAAERARRAAEAGRRA